MDRTAVLAANYQRVDVSIGELSGVGEKNLSQLEKLGVSTIFDLLYHFPRRYLDLSTQKPISTLSIGEEATVVGQVVEVAKRRTQRGKPDVLQVSVADKSSYLAAVWFNQNFLASSFKEGSLVALSGKVSFRYGCFQMNSPLFEIIDDPGDLASSLNLGRIISLYPASKGIYQKQLRKWARTALDMALPLPDPFPLEVLAGEYLPLNRALSEIHFPASISSLKQARRRFRFEELFYLQLAVLLRKAKTEGRKGYSHRIEKGVLDPLLEALPYKLTSWQQQVIQEVFADMASPRVMHRLVQGEVGSGKTVVAAAALLAAAASGRQGALMAPTEVLAYQHHEKINQWLAPLGLKTVLLTSNAKGKNKKSLLDEVASGEADVVIGTHALIQEEVAFKELSLVIVDEQHRFGVEQRLALREKGTEPDTLVMTATPIPRTLALTFYGDLDISSIQGLPPGRSPVATNIYEPDQRDLAYQRVEEELAKGRQAMIICPLVGEEDSSSERKAVMQELANVRGMLPQYRAEALHGKMDSKTKLSVLEAYAKGEISVLVSTTVVEVGIDVPNATAILVEEANRFGLAQLHQLRGRVGRGSYPGCCLLVADTSSNEAQQRMEAMMEGLDGFALAELDLKIRGEGQLSGRRQSGLPDLKLASLPSDLELLGKAREKAVSLLSADPELAKAANAILRKEVARRHGDLVYWMGSG